MIKHITSTANPEIKNIRALELRKYRDKEGLFITEGLRHAIEAAEAGWDFDTIAIEENALNNAPVKKLLSLVAKQRCRTLSVSQKVMQAITHRDNAQNVVAVIRQRWAEMTDVKAEGDAIWIALEEIRDPGNLGTIMRTADATGARGIVLIGNCCDPFSLEAIRASMGSFPQVRIAHGSRDEFIRQVKGSKFQIVGTHLKTDYDYRNISYKGPVIILMGNEQAGLTDDMSKTCTKLVKIPMRGKADSLNVSVATAIMLYEANRERFKINAD